MKGKKNQQTRPLLAPVSFERCVCRNFDPWKYFTLFKSHHNKLPKISMHWCVKRVPMMNRFIPARLAERFSYWNPKLNILIHVEVVIYSPPSRKGEFLKVFIEINLFRRMIHSNGCVFTPPTTSNSQHIFCFNFWANIFMIKWHRVSAKHPKHFTCSGY